MGVFVGFDDNRSLGEGETGATDAVPVFMDFMKVALDGQPVVDFKPPKTAKFAMVRGVREAFRPGTEPRVEVAPSSGPIPYNQLSPGLPPVPQPQAQPGKPPPQKVDPLSGLY